MFISVTNLLCTIAVTGAFVAYIIRLERKISGLCTDIAWIKEALQKQNPED